MNTVSINNQNLTNFGKSPFEVSNIQSSVQSSDSNNCFNYHNSISINESTNNANNELNINKERLKTKLEIRKRNLLSTIKNISTSNSNNILSNDIDNYNNEAFNLENLLIDESTIDLSKVSKDLQTNTNDISLYINILFREIFEIRNINKNTNSLYFTDISNFKYSILKLRRLMLSLEETEHSQILKNIINKEFDYVKFETLLSALEIFSSNTIIVYEILVILTNLLFALDNLPQNCLVLCCDKIFIVKNAFVNCASQEFRYIVINYLSNLLLISNGMMQYNTQIVSLKDSKENKNISNDTSVNVLDTKFIINLFTVYNQSTKLFLKNQIIELTGYLCKFSQITINSNNNNDSKIQLPQDTTLILVKFLGEYLANEIGLTLFYNNNTNNNTVNYPNYSSTDEFNNIFSHYITLINNFYNNEEITLALYNSGIVVVVINKLMSFLGLLDTSLKTNNLAILNQQNKEIININNINLYLTILKYACCGNFTLIRELVKIKIISLFYLGITVFSSYQSNNISNAIVNSIVESVLNIVLDSRFINEVTNSEILSNINNYIILNMRNISYQILYNYLSILDLIVIFNPQKNLGLINQMKSLNLIIKILNGEINDESSVLKLPEMLIAKVLETLFCLFHNSIEISINKNDVILINDFKSLNGELILEKLIGHPNSDIVANEAYRIQTTYFKKNLIN